MTTSGPARGRGADTLDAVPAPDDPTSPDPTAPRPGDAFRHVPKAEGEPIRVARDLVERVWTNSARFPRDAVDAYLATVVPESARAMNERNNIHGIGLRVAGPEAFAGLPIVVITGDEDPRHPRATDAEVATFVGAEFVWLPDVGLPGHGHMQMIEHGNLAIADLFDRWLIERGL